MTIVLHPAHLPVPANDAVFRAVQLLLGFANLANNLRTDTPIVLRVHHAPKGIARQLPEFRLAGAAKKPMHGPVGINQFLRALRPVDEKTAGHMSADLLDKG